jgi:hypothetical protein
MRLPVSLSLTSVTLALVIACGSNPAPKKTTQTAAIPVPSVSTAEPRVVSFPAVPRDLTDADFEQHVKDLRNRITSKLGRDDFSIIIQRPFVVVGDESEDRVKQHATDTVKWAVDRLKQEYFKNDPNDILEIWLFKDNSSYRTNAKLMFGDDPTTPYGYYSRAHKALLMNINTGGGTLVHEIVHPLMEANFPACPSWFNEGMGSLYEQCGETNGHIHGYTNWRLPGLQRAIREKRLPSFESLMAMDANTFYNGDNYGQARYLCYYLQDKGLLQKFYHEFVSKQKEDPSGYKTLQRILGESDMTSFQSRWEKYVMTLTVGYSVEVQ